MVDDVCGCACMCMSEPCLGCGVCFVLRFLLESFLTYLVARIRSVFVLFGGHSEKNTPRHAYEN